MTCFKTYDKHTQPVEIVVLTDENMRAVAEEIGESYRETPHDTYIYITKVGFAYASDVLVRYVGSRTVYKLPLGLAEGLVGKDFLQGAQ